MRVLAWVVLLATVAGCAAKSHTKVIAGRDGLPRHIGPVCFLKSPLPPDVKHTVIGQIKGGKKTYGSFNEVYAVMAEEARRVGADAVVGLDARTDINAVAWARPVAQGAAIKLSDPASFDCQKWGGAYR